MEFLGMLKREATKVLRRTLSDVLSGRGASSHPSSVGRSGSVGKSEGAAPAPRPRSQAALSAPRVWSVLDNPLPGFSYSPHPDGVADPGEVVWAWIPFEEDPSRGKDRPVLVLARQGQNLVVSQLTSKDHDLDAAHEAHWGRYWFDIGSGAWDSRRRPSEARLDHLYTLSADSVRREGARLEKSVFDAYCARLHRFAKAGK